MADPEQIYQEVLTEEQGKGVSAAVAEGRAKAARSRAEHGSPHPKEPKWWPGGQPHLEGDGAAPAAEAAEAPAAEAEVAVEAEPAAAPAAEAEPAEPAAEPAAPAAEAEPAEAPAAEAEPAAEPAAAAPPEAAAAPAPEPAGVEAAPAEKQPAAAPAAPAAPAEPAPAPAAAAAEPVARPAGVTHGTATGTRVRPEDAVTTEAQFQGQEAMYERRRLIDELIASGVPATAAAEAGERRSPMLAILYLLIPLLAIAIVLAQNDAGGGKTPPGPGPEEGVTVTAASVAFDTDEITLPADEESAVTIDNQDSTLHNWSIYETEDAETDLYIGPDVAAGSSLEYTVPALKKGEYFFRCDYHPTSMTGTLIVE